MQNKQTYYGSKELFCFCFTSNHDRHASIMRNCALIVLVLLISSNFGVKAAPTNATNIADSRIRESTKELFTQSNNHALSADHSLITRNNYSLNDTSKVRAVYNAVHNKIQLNITWVNPLVMADLHSYSFKISPNSSLAYCGDKSLKIFKQNETLTNILLPHFLNKYEVIPGCTYRISIRLISTQLHVLRNISNITYTVPECVGVKCNCKKLSPPVTKLEANEIYSGKLNITWETDKTANYKVSKITNAEFGYRLIKSKSFHNDAFIKLDVLPNFTKGGNNLVLNDTRPFENGEMYQLEAIFSNGYNCNSNKYTTFTISNTKMSKNTKQNSHLEGKVRNTQIYAIYNNLRNKILLNVTWEKPLDFNHTQAYDFKIAPKDNHPHCMHEHESFETIKKDKNLTSILLPPLLHKYDILPGCTYKVNIITDRSHLGKSESEVIYKVPECVGKKCSCINLAPQISNLEAVEISPGKLNISWEINQTENNTTTNNITNAVFQYRPSISDQPHNNPFKKLLPLSDLSIEKRFLILDDTSAFLPNESYQLQAIFNNTYNCRVYNYTNFSVSVTKVEVHVNKNSSNTSNWVQLVLFLLLSSFLILAMIYILRRNRLIIKEILRNPLSLRITRRRHRPEERNSYIMVPTIAKRQQETNPLYVDKEIIDGDVDHYEFPRSRISEPIRELGKGAFGQVYLAKAFGIDQKPGYTYVAVKTLREKAPPAEVDDFLSEIEILKKVGEHPHVVRIFGCCVLKEPYLMVMEFVPCGDLKNYLLDLREKWGKKRTRNDSTPVFSDGSDGAYVLPDSPMPRRIPSEGRPSVTETEYTSFESDGFPTPTELFNNKLDSSLDHTELQNFALQIAKGMKHLEKVPIAHRDLAARNILINEYKTLKISDFGLSRVGPYVNSRTQKLPLRWVSLEAIEDHFYDSKGDVWSFAVVLWEIGTLGAFPYEQIQDGMLPHYLASGKRLPRPEICTDELYSLMLRCWSREPQLRPSFEELVELLDVKKRRIYVDFNQLNPLYVFPPSKVQEVDKRLNSQRSESTA